jgi:cyclopropane-fatty-acyl-phospholipid synthase
MLQLLVRSDTNEESTKESPVPRLLVSWNRSSRYIFPGGEHDHIGNTLAMLQRNGFEVHDVEGWREHYQRTCKLWHDRLLANYSAAIAEVGEVTTRLWLAYLAASSIAFERNGACLYQTLSSKRRRGSSGLPPTRADLYSSPGPW